MVRVSGATAPLCKPRQNQAMGTLYLVRHGQASFGAADYDQLSDLGQRQCERLGAWFRSRGARFDAVLTGTLKRHAQSLAAIETGLGACHQAQAWPGLDEYDSEAVVRAVHAGALPAPDTPEAVRQHFRLLRQGLAAWMAGAVQPAGLPAHGQWGAAIVAALDHVRAQHASGDVLIVSSGGPISHAVGHVLGLAADAVIDLNLHRRNSAVCEFKVNPKRHTLIGFNALPHLDTLPAPEHEAWVTYA
jgi:broad specificity phosphatase PhoE